MARKAKVTICKIIDAKFQEAMKTFKPIFGEPDYITIIAYLEKLQLKSTTPEQSNSLKSKIIYLLTKDEKS